MLPKAPDIPFPKPDDKDYMTVWHKYLQADIERIHMESQRDTWRRAFYAVAAILFLLMFALLVLCGSKLFTLHSSLFT